MVHLLRFAPLLASFAGCLRLEAHSSKQLNRGGCSFQIVGEVESGRERIWEVLLRLLLSILSPFEFVELGAVSMGNVRAARFDVPGRHKLCLNNLVQSNILVLQDQPSNPSDISVRCRVEDEVPGNAVQKNAENLSRHDRRKDFSGKDGEKGTGFRLSLQPSF